MLVLSDVSLQIAPGELLAIIGPSGCGKTTLLNLISGLEPVISGMIEIDGKPPQAGQAGVAYMFARDALLPWRTARANVELPLELQGLSKRVRRQRARRALVDVGLEGFESSYRSQLSQGMRQRIALARTIAMEPRVLLMDEPFGALDAQTRLSVQESFMQLRDRLGATSVLITHDLAEAVALGDRVAVLSRRPGVLKSIYHIDLPRPRSIMSLQADAAFHEHYERVWQALAEEVDVHVGEGDGHVS